MIQKIRDARRVAAPKHPKSQPKWAFCQNPASMCGYEAVSVGALVAGHRYAMQRRRPPSAIDVALKGEREKDLVLRIRRPTYPRRVLFQKERVARVCPAQTPKQTSRLLLPRLPPIHAHAGSPYRDARTTALFWRGRVEGALYHMDTKSLRSGSLRRLGSCLHTRGGSFAPIVERRAAAAASAFSVARDNSSRHRRGSGLPSAGQNNSLLSI